MMNTRNPENTFFDVTSEQLQRHEAMLHEQARRIAVLEEYVKNGWKI
jgi:hypothetical protein